MITNIHKPKNSNGLNKHLVLLVEDKFEDLEFWYTKLRLIEEGADIIVAAPEIKKYIGLHGLTATPDVIVDDIDASQYDGIIIPGGYAPDFLRRYENILSLVRAFDEEQKLIAYICHAGWVPISAKIVAGRRVTGLIAIKDDLINAGGKWVDEPAVVDGNLISSRRPNDLPCFCSEIITFLRKQ